MRQLTIDTMIRINSFFPEKLIFFFITLSIIQASP